MMSGIDNKIEVFYEKGKYVLKFADYNIKTEAYIGKNGITKEKKEGDGKTPIGNFKLGIILGTHPKEEFVNKTNYLQINKNMYWVDDSKSKYYNKLVDITREEKDWDSAEHLIDYPVQYEYLIEVKVNPNNIPEKGSAIFIHCIKKQSTEGCIAIDKTIMKQLIENINEETTIEINNH